MKHLAMLHMKNGDRIERDVAGVRVVDGTEFWPPTVDLEVEGAQRRFWLLPSPGTRVRYAEVDS